MMHLRIYLILISIITSQYVTVDAARKVNVQKRYAEGMDSYTTWRQRRDAGIPSHEPTINELLGLEPGEHLQETASITTAAGTTKEKLAETYEDLPVFGQGVVIETDQGEPTGSISGHLIEGIHDDIPDTDPALSEEEALALAAASVGDNVDDISMDSAIISLEVYTEEQSVLDSVDDVAAVLAYRLSYVIMRDGEPSRPSFILDANTGDIILSWDGMASRYAQQHTDHADTYTLITEGGNVKIGPTRYGTYYPPLEVPIKDGLCYLENDKLRIIDVRNYQGLNVSFTFPCEQGFNDSSNGAFSPMADGYFYGNLAYDVFENWLGVEPLNSKIIIVIHMPHENAYWNGKVISIGNGKDYFYPLVTADIMGHEVAHAFTERNSGLIYRRQSGAINEAFSDMAGAAAQQYLGKTDWMNGYDVKKSLVDSIGLRYLFYPTLDGVSIDHTSQYCPDMDVHHSSGIYNRAFYLLTNSEGWTLRKAFEVFGAANRLYWTPDTTFNAAACGVMQAAGDLGYNTDDVARAFSEVGITPCSTHQMGMVLVSELHALQNETLTFRYVAPPYLESLRFEAYGTSGGEWALSARTPEGELSTSNSYDSIDISSPPPGTYTVTITALANFQRVNLYAITGEHLLAENLDFGDISIANISFHLPPEVVRLGHPVALRTVYSDTAATQDHPKLMGKPGAEHPVTKMTDHFKSQLRTNDRTSMHEVFLCHPTADVYRFRADVGEDETVGEGLNLVMVSLLLPQPQ